MNPKNPPLEGPQTATKRRVSALKRWLPVAIVLVAGALIWRSIGSQTFDPKKFIQTFTLFDPVLLVAAAVAGLVTYLGRAIRWKVMIRTRRPDAPLGRLMVLNLIGFTAAVLLGRAGEFVRPYLIAKDLRLPVSSQVAVWFLERLTDLIAVLVIFGFALTRFDSGAAAKVGPELAWVLESGGRVLGAVGGFAMASIIGLRFFGHAAEAWSSRMVARLPGAVGTKASELMRTFWEGMESTRTTPALAALLGYSFLEWALIGVCYYLVLLSFPGTAGLSWIDTLVVLGFISFGSAVQLPGVGGGMQVVAVLVLTQMFGQTIEHATALATLLWLIGLAVVVPPGLVLALREGVQWTRIAATD